MNIKHARPARGDLSPNGFRTLLRFALEPTDGVLIFDCTLVRAPDGRLLVYGPSSTSAREILSLAPAVRRQIIEMTLIEAGIDNDEHSEAA